MLLDHALLYHGDANAWPRQTLTRVVEPLYVFVFGYLISRHNRPSITRWAQLALAALLETVLHSTREGHLHVGILASLALVWPLLFGATRLKPYALLTCSVGFGLIALMPMPWNSGAITVDYGPSLVLSQVTLAAAFQRRVPQLSWYLLLIWPLQLTTVGYLDRLGFEPQPNLSTLLIGHPLALLIGWAAIKVSWRPPALLHWIAKAPLRFYIGHLACLALAQQCWK